MSPASLFQSSSDEHLFTSAKEMPQNGHRELIVSDKEHDRVNRVAEMLLSKELEEAIRSLEARYKALPEVNSNHKEKGPWSRRLNPAFDRPRMGLSNMHEDPVLPVREV
jgi:hypothetical protein